MSKRAFDYYSTALNKSISSVQMTSIILYSFEASKLHSKCKFCMKGIIIYQGRYGATDQYAQWLAATLKFPMIKARDAEAVKLYGYDLVILGSSVYVGKLLISAWFKRNIPTLVQKKLMMFIVSGTTTHDDVARQKVIHDNIPPPVRDMIKVFFLPGRCVVSKLSWKDRLVLKMGAWLEKDPDKKAVMKNGFDEVDESSLALLIAAVKAIV